MDEAIACYRRALEVDPDYAWAHYDLANSLREVGRREEALEHYRRFHDLDPTNTHVTNILRADLVYRGRGEEVRREWKKSLEANPPGHDAWFGYAELCLFLGDEVEYRRARQDLIRRFGTTSDPYVAERTARAILLLPAAEEELEAAAALVERAVAAKATTDQWVYPYFLFAQGLVEYRQGRFDSAISIMTGDAGSVMGPAPRLVVAMAEHRKGQKEEARKTLAAAIIGFDWSAAQVGSRDHWIWHVLRREAEALILPNLRAFLRDSYNPQDNDERLALVGICQFEGRFHAAARLYADAFATDPALAKTLISECRPRAARGDRQPVGRIEELAPDCRYSAARCAALAGCGLGADGGKLSAGERRRWRKQARAWLRADLAARARTLDSGSPAARVLVRKMLTLWRAEPELSGLREPTALDKLSPDERKECLALWKEVATVLQRTQRTK
jgi:serine/threonine-protein kinase